LPPFLVTSYVPVIAMLIWDDKPVAAAIFSLVPIVCLAPWYGSVTALLAPLAIYIFQLIAFVGDTCRSPR